MYVLERERDSGESERERKNINNDEHLVYCNLAISTFKLNAFLILHTHICKLKLNLGCVDV